MSGPSLNSAPRKRERELSATDIARGLRELTSLARSGVAGKELRERIVEHAHRFFAADAVAMWRLESREHIWRIAASFGLSADYSTFAIPAPTDGDVASLLPAPLLIPDARAWPLVDDRRKLYDVEGIVSFLVLPLDIRGETVGTITCYYRAAKAVASEAEMEVAAAFAQIASVALSTERFDRLAEVARDVAGKLDLEAIVQRITDAATSLTGAQFGAFFYNVVRADGEAYTLTRSPECRASTSQSFRCRGTLRCSRRRLPGPESSAVQTSRKIHATGRTRPTKACPRATCRW